MPDSALRMLAFASAAVIVYGSGFRLTRSGWPFGVVLLNVHKLVALATVLFAGVFVQRSDSLPGASWVAVAVAAALCLVSFVSGGIVSALESAPPWVVRTHRIGAWFAGAGVALCLAVIV